MRFFWALPLLNYALSYEMTLPIILSPTSIGTEMGKRAFHLSAPSYWNDLRAEMKMSELITLGDVCSIFVEVVTLVKEALI